jgi:hypothetical protein
MNPILSQIPHACSLFEENIWGLSKPESINNSEVIIFEQNENQK